MTGHANHQTQPATPTLVPAVAKLGNLGATELSWPSMHRRTVLGGILLAFACTPRGREEVDLGDEPEPTPNEPAYDPSTDLEFRPMAEIAHNDGLARNPALVLVIPEDEGVRWHRAHVFGELFNHGDDASLAPLALFDVFCAPMRKLRTQFRNLPRHGEPWLVVIDRTVNPPVAVSLTDPKLDTLAAVELREADIDARMARLAALLAAAVNPKTVERLAGHETVNRSEAFATEVRMTMQQGVPLRTVVLETAAASLYHWAHIAPVDSPFTESHPAIRKHHQEVASTNLAHLARERWVRSRPPAGSAWARGHGCGVRIEGDFRPSGIACGMGHVPERSTRFLSFLTNDGDY